jgi:hypothetical protein
MIIDLIIIIMKSYKIIKLVNNVLRLYILVSFLIRDELPVCQFIFK